MNRTANVCAIEVHENGKMFAKDSSTGPKYANGKIIVVGQVSNLPQSSPKILIVLKLLLIKKC